MRSLSEIEVGEAGVDDDVYLVDGTAEGDAIEKTAAAECGVGYHLSAMTRGLTCESRWKLCHPEVYRKL
jgi:hypothetical protein